MQSSEQCVQRSFVSAFVAKLKTSMEISRTFKVLLKLSAAHQMNEFIEIVCLLHKYM